MTDLVALVKSTLSEINILSAFQHVQRGSSLPEYVTFLTYHEEPELEAGDVEVLTARFVQVNVWSRGDYTALVKKVRNKLESVGFERISEFDAPYDDGDSHFNKVLRFSFNDEYNN